MKNNTVILIGGCVVVICVTIVICMKMAGKNKKDNAIWGTTSYSADAMNSLAGAFQAAAAEGGAGEAMWE